MSARGVLLWAMVCSAALLPVRAEVPVDAEQPRDALPKKLDGILEQAIAAGLLNRPGTVDNHAEPISTAPIPAPPAVCTEHPALDFSSLAGIAAYSDLTTPPGKTSPKPIDRARLYIALDMQSEALTALGGQALPDALMLRALAELLEGRRTVDVAVFEARAACAEDGALWRAAAYTLAGDARGRAALNSDLTAYRALPLRLRSRVAGRLVPVLVNAGDTALATKLLSAFTADEIAEAGGLVVAGDVLAFALGDNAAEARLRTHALSGRFQAVAFSALQNRNVSFDPRVHGMIVEQVVMQMGAADGGDGREAELVQLLAPPAEAADYPMLLRLAAQFESRSAGARRAVDSVLAARLADDLAADAPARNLAALNVLAGHAVLETDPPRRLALQTTAIAVAERLRLDHIAEALSQQAALAPEAAAHSADIARRQRAHQTAIDLYAAHPAHPALARSAALSAIAANNPAAMDAAAPHLPLDRESVLALIEADAAAANWLLPEAVYDAARKLSGDADKRRMRRVFALRAEARGDGPGPSSDTGNALPDRIEAARRGLDALALEER
jgi:hypothetical protein